MDLISVIIPTYNRFNYLLNALDSIKKQTYTNIEIIVVNDSSTQNEYYILKKLFFVVYDILTFFRYNYFKIIIFRLYKSFSINILNVYC